MKVRQLLQILDAMTVVHSNAGAVELADCIRKFSKAIEGAAKEDVSNLVKLIRKQGNRQD